MKDITKIFAVLAAITAGTVAYGQEYNYYFNPRNERPHASCRNMDRRSNEMPDYNIRVNIAAEAPLATSRFLYGRSFSSYYYPGDEDLKDMYGDYHGPTYSTGLFGIGADIFLKRWFALSADLNFNFLWNDRYDSFTKDRTGTKTGVAVYFIPRAKFYYLNRPLVRLYGSIGLGVVKYFGFDKLKYIETSYDNVEFKDETFDAAFQISPIGIEFGRRLFGFAEMGAGTMYAGFQFGMGYRF